MEKLNKKTPLWVRVLIIILGALFISTLMLGNSYARFVSTASGSDSASIAKFSFDDDLSEQFTDISISLAPGERQTYRFTIKNTGEVTIRYVVKIDNMTENLPIYDKIISSDNIAIGGELTFDWDIEWDKNHNSIDYMGKMDVLRVTVTAEQVD